MLKLKIYHDFEEITVLHLLYVRTYHTSRRQRDLQIHRRLSLLGQICVLMQLKVVCICSEKEISPGDTEMPSVFVTYLCVNICISITKLFVLINRENVTVDVKITLSDPGCTKPNSESLARPLESKCLIYGRKCSPATFSSNFIVLCKTFLCLCVGGGDIHAAQTCV